LRVAQLSDHTRPTAGRFGHAAGPTAAGSGTRPGAARE
jgi:hypothetical protein